MGESVSETDREVRSGRMFQAAVENARIGQQRVTIRNVSEHGLGGRSQVPLEPGEQLVVTLQGLGRIDATVRWSDGSRFGLRLDRPIDPSRLTFGDKDWSVASAAVLMPTDRASDRFKPVTSTWRPGFRHR